MPYFTCQRPPIENIYLYYSALEMVVFVLRRSSACRNFVANPSCADWNRLHYAHGGGARSKRGTPRGHAGEGRVLPHELTNHHYHHATSSPYLRTRARVQLRWFGMSRDWRHSPHLWGAFHPATPWQTLRGKTYFGTSTRPCTRPYVGFRVKAFLTFT